MNIQREDPVQELEKEHRHWKEIYENGCFDPLYADGINLNLTRNHILYYRSQIEELYDGREKPAIYYEAVPEEVDNHFIAKKDEILMKAIDLYETFTQMPEVNALLHSEEYLAKRELEELRIDIDINRINGLYQAISSLDYVQMRALSSHPEQEIEAVRQAHQRLCERNHQEGEQLSLFEMTM